MMKAAMEAIFIGFYHAAVEACNKSEGINDAYLCPVRDGK
jgi:hypothetical protein